MSRAAALLLTAAAMLPTVVHAQALSCAIPDRLPRPHAEGPTPSEPRRVLPIGGYTLALSWTPQICAGDEGRDRDGLQCGRGAMARFGFVLHGLWPDGKGRDWPQYCRPAAILSPQVIRGALCATPSVQLVQHEWAKHGTCTGQRPAAYFARGKALFQAVRYPDMRALAARRDLTVSAFARVFAAADRRLRPDMIKVQTTRQGWLSEVWLCLDTRFAPMRCAGSQQRASAPLRIAMR